MREYIKVLPLFSLITFKFLFKFTIGQFLSTNLIYDKDFSDLLKEQIEAQKTGQYSRHIDICEKLLEIINNGRILNRLGNLQCDITVVRPVWKLQTLSNLGYSYILIGRLKEGESILLQGLDYLRNIRDERLNLSCIEGTMLSILGFSDLLSYNEFLNQNLLDEATEKLHDAINQLSQSVIILEDLTINNLNNLELISILSRALNTLGTAYLKDADYAKAKVFYLKAIKLYISRFQYLIGENLSLQRDDLIKIVNEFDPLSAPEPFKDDFQRWAETLTYLGELYYDSGSYKSAERLYMEALKLLKKITNAEQEYVSNLAQKGLAFSLFKEIEHPYCEQVLVGLSKLSAVNNKPKEALDYILKVAQISRYKIRQVFTSSSETDRLAFIQAQRDNFNLLLSLVCTYLSEDNDAVKLALDFVLRNKSLTASALATQNQAIFSDRYPELKEKFEKLKSISDDIVKLTYSQPSPDKRETLHKKQEEFNTLQRELADKVPEIKLEQDLQNTNCDSVVLALPKNSVLIEIVRFDVYNFQAIPARGESRLEPSRYLAFVLPKDKPEEIKMIDLGVAEEIDSMIRDFLHDASDGQGNTLDMGDDDDKTKPISIREHNPQTAINLSQRLLTPILSEIGEAKHLFVAPDCDLNLIPFNILPLDTENTLLMDLYTISYLSVGRDTLRLKIQPTNSTSQPLVIADPDFDLETSQTTEDSPEESFPEIEDLRQNIGNRPFHRTTGTRILGEVVAQTLEVEPYLGEEALESVITNSKSPSIFFIATHGVFLSQSPSQPSFSNNQIPLNLSGGISNRLLEANVENPMLRSGLALAGANVWLSGGSLSGSPVHTMLNCQLNAKIIKLYF